MQIDYKVGIYHYRYSDLKKFSEGVMPDEIEKLHLAQKEIIADEIFTTLRNIHDIKKKLQKKSRTETKLKELQALSKYYDKYINNEKEFFSISFYGWSIDSVKEIKEVIGYKLEEATTAVEEIERARNEKEILQLKKECYSKIIYILKNNGISHKQNKITSTLMSFFKDLKIRGDTTPYKNRLLEKLKKLQWSQSYKPLTLRDFNYQWIEFHNRFNTFLSFTKQSQIQLQRQYFKIPFLLPNKYSQTIPKDLREYYFIELILLK